ncbi:hypothetical protein CYMTET_24260 [Cymbomonas tetramitiformis]|uniref:Uncharacterized protein n=1 Tax=Cymbomonas tetramitiformis TaxID=36881 RepID=A0AAE0FWY1_9CHLO|nr:hypothetical protein CYMTET_24260 [Cymbomonas tetramitiformis]
MTFPDSPTNYFYTLFSSPLPSPHTPSGVTPWASGRLGLTEGELELHEAARRGDQEALMRLLREKPNLEERDHNGHTALHLAVENGRTASCKLLIRQGANVHCTPGIETSKLLLLAAPHGDPQLLEALLAAGAPVNVRDEEHVTPLIMTAKAGDFLECVELLVKADAEVNAADKSGMTALHHASKTGRVLIIKPLLSAGALTKITDANGATPRATARQHGHAQVLRLLEGEMRKTPLARSQTLPQDIPSDIPSRHTPTPTRFSPEARTPVVRPPQVPKLVLPPSGLSLTGVGRHNSINSLSSEKAQSGAPTSALTPRTPTVSMPGTPGSYHSPRSSSPRINGRLLMPQLSTRSDAFSANSSPQNTDRLMVTARPMHSSNIDIHVAATNGSVNQLRAHLRRGEDANIPDDVKATPLHWAADGGHVECIRLLLNAGATPAARDEVGATPLHWACGAGHTMCVEQLLEAIGVSSMSHVANQAHEAKQRCAQMEAREELVMAGLQDLQRKLLSGSQTSEGAARQVSLLMNEMKQTKKMDSVDLLPQRCAKNESSDESSSDTESEPDEVNPYSTLCRRVPHVRGPYRCRRTVGSDPYCTGAEPQWR